MIWRRILYLSILAGCLVLCLILGQWLWWMLFFWLLALPVCSLIISLPAMCTVKVSLQCPRRVAMKEQARPELKLTCRFPLPPVVCKFGVRTLMTGEQFIYDQDEWLQSFHCGAREIGVWRLWVYDYMGILRRRVRVPETCTLTVTPLPVEISPMPPIARSHVSGYRPQAGGFSENHEHRLYRPGDDLRHIHWKLTAKTGKLILREPLRDVHGKLVLSVGLWGSAFSLDEKLGKLLWLSQSLLEQGLSHEIHCVTGEQMLTFSVTDAQRLASAMDGILAGPVAQKPVSIDAGDALWQYHIGGSDHEA